MDNTVTVIDHGETVRIHIPMRLHCRIGRKEIITPDNASPQGPMVDAISSAWKWQKMIDTGEYASASKLADKMGMDRSYVIRTMRLLLLAPDIIEAIMNGKEPSGMSMNELRNVTTGVWEEQRKELGISY
jgi:hypothetical protein